MRLLSTLPSLVVVLVVAGCGSGSAKTVTVTSAPTQPTSAPPTPADQLVAYLVSMKRAERQWYHAQRLWRKDDRVHYYANTAPWPAIGRKLQKVRREFDDSAVYLTSLTPPHGLLKAHRAWISSVKMTSGEVDSYVTAFKQKDSAAVYRLDNNQALLRQIGAARTTWRIAVRALAQQLGVKVPPALRKVGTGY